MAVGRQTQKGLWLAMQESSPTLPTSGSLPLCKRDDMSTASRGFEATVLSELSVLRTKQEDTTKTLERMEGYFDKIFERLDDSVSDEDCRRNRDTCLKSLHQQKGGGMFSSSKIGWWALGIMATLLITCLSLLYHEMGIVRTMATELSYQKTQKTSTP